MVSVKAEQAQPERQPLLFGLGHADRPVRLAWVVGEADRGWNGADAVDNGVVYCGQ